jgi:hypothetical protein
MSRWKRRKSGLKVSMEEVVEMQLASECVKYWRYINETEEEIQKLLWFFEFEGMGEGGNYDTVES